jgi:hypothetical protein
MLRFVATETMCPGPAPGFSISRWSPDRDVEQEREVVHIDGASLFG